MPLSLYMDGVPYSKTDSMLGIWAYNEISKMRHLMVILRRRCWCRCGCKGWCSLFPIWKFVAWCFNALALGRMPGDRCDGKEWDAGQDATRASRGNEWLPFRGALCRIKGDLPEFSGSFGFPGFASVRRPCFKCNWFPGLGFAEPLVDLNPYQFPTVLTSQEDYEEACERCEQRRLISRAERDAMIPLLD